MLFSNKCLTVFLWMVYAHFKKLPKKQKPTKINLAGFNLSFLIFNLPSVASGIFQASQAHIGQFQLMHTARAFHQKLIFDF